MTNVLIITYTPSPYQVELFNTIAREGRISIKVVYLYTREKGRLWDLLPFHHDYVLLNDDPTSAEVMSAWAAASDLIVFNYYQHSKVLSLLNHHAASKKPWCFWGERPGYHRYGLLGIYYRKWRLQKLAQSQAPIWGIGQWAVAQYRHEFGNRRPYANLPYYSDLNRFQAAKIRDRTVNKHRNFLYSGALIQRKGVDLLAQAFSRLADKNPQVTLTVMGNGPLEASLRERLSRHQEKVNFIGFQQWQDLPMHYQLADILCVPSRYDGWGLVVPEGLASGLPVIATNQTGAAVEFIETEKNGWLIPVNQVNALYEALQKAADLDLPTLQDYAINAKQAVANHSLAEGAQKFMRCVQAALNV